MSFTVLAVLAACAPPTAQSEPGDLLPALSLSGNLTGDLVYAGTLEIVGDGISDVSESLTQESISEQRVEMLVPGGEDVEVRIELIPENSADYRGPFADYRAAEHITTLPNRTTEVDLSPAGDRTMLLGIAEEGDIVRSRDLSSDPHIFDSGDFWPEGAGPYTPSDYAPHFLIIEPIADGSFFVLVHDDSEGDAAHVTLQSSTGEGAMIVENVAGLQHLGVNEAANELYLADRDEEPQLQVFEFDFSNPPDESIGAALITGINNITDIDDAGLLGLTVDGAGNEVFIQQAEGAPDSPEDLLIHISRVHGDDIGGDGEPSRQVQLDWEWFENIFTLDSTDVFQVGEIAHHHEHGVLLGASAVNEDDEVYESAFVVFDDRSLEYERTIVIREAGETVPDDGAADIPIEFLSVGRRQALVRMFIDDSEDPWSFGIVDLESGDVVASARGADLELNLPVIAD